MGGEEEEEEYKRDKILEGRRQRDWREKRTLLRWKEKERDKKGRKNIIKSIYE